MTARPSVVIVGAGALGLATAWHLTRRGATDVTVLERGQVAGASSGLSVGIIETQYLDALAIEIRVASMRAFDELEDSGAITITRNGYLRLAHREADLEAFHRSVEKQRSFGVTDCRVVDREGLRELVPDMAVDDLLGGLFGPHDGYIDGHRYCAALASAVIDAGGRVLQETEMLGVDSGGGGRRAWIEPRAASSTATSSSMPPAVGPVVSAIASGRRSRSCRSATRH